MAFQSAHERFLRERIADAEQEIVGVAARRADEQRHMEEFQRQHAAKMSDFDRACEIAEVTLTAYRSALESFLSTRSGALSGKRSNTSRRGRGRGLSTQWQRQHDKLPQGPERGLTADEFTRLVWQDHPNISRNAVRSQLTAGKKTGRLENIDGRWRRVAPQEVEAPDDSSDPHRTSGASSNGAGAWAVPGTP